jgi:hypothetical protein
MQGPETPVGGGFDVGYKTICQKHAEGESLDKDFYEYVCDSILAEADMPADAVAEIVRSFYPDYAIDDDDVALFTEAARALHASRNSLDVTAAAAIEAAPLPPLEEDESETSSEEEIEIWTEKNVEDISFISSVFPSLDMVIIEFVYANKCAKNVEPSVQYLLEHCSDEAGVEKMVAKMADRVERAEREAEREAQTARTMQATVFRKYGDQAVKYRGGDVKKGKKDQKVELMLDNNIDNKPKKTKVSTGGL